MADIGDSASELGGIQAYFNGLIAAARNGLSRAEAATVIRSLRSQKILAMRAARDRRRATRANQKTISRSPQPAPLSVSKRQLG